MTGSAQPNPLPMHCYEIEDGRFIPTGRSVSPWNSRHQNGVVLAGLVAHIADQHPTPIPMTTVRIITDIMHPTAMAPITSHVEVLREGRNLQLLGVSLIAEAGTTVKATVLRVRQVDTPPDPHAQENASPPDASAPPFLPERSVLGRIFETRLVSGGLDECGAGSCWSRVEGQLVLDTPVTPLVHAAMFADFGSGIGAMLPRKEWSFANVDISLHLTRAPVGEWLRQDAATQSAGNGVAVVSGKMFDVKGAIGRTHQTLFVNRISG